MGLFEKMEAMLALPAHRLTWAEIDLENLLFNISGIRKLVGPETELIGVVKADAYGHGFEVIQTMQDVGVRTFAVAFLDEAIVLRQKGIDDSDIILLGYTPKEFIPELVQWRIQPAVYQLDFAKAMSDYCIANDVVMPIHLKVDTGMGRIGWRWDEAADEIEKIAAMPGLQLRGMFTHFAVADCTDKTFTDLQMQRYRQVAESLEQRGIDIPLKHIENSAAIIDFDKTVYDGVRPGIILYGLYPSDEVMRDRLPLKPVMSFKTRIVHIKTIHAGDSLGYGRKYIASDDRRIATLPVGYADGYSRMLSEKGTEVLIRGQRAPIVGNICMDQCMVDITNIPEAQLLDEVELFGENLLVDEIAGKLGTINYEVVCMINKRVPRVYQFKGGKHLEVEILKTDYHNGRN